MAGWWQLPKLYKIKSKGVTLHIISFIPDFFRALCIMDNSRVSPLSLHHADMCSVAEVSEAASVLVDPEDGGRTYLRNIKYTAHIDTVQRPKSKLT
jgi:hypothetical protein